MAGDCKITMKKCTDALSKIRSRLNKILAGTGKTGCQWKRDTNNSLSARTTCNRVITGLVMDRHNEMQEIHL